MKDKPKGKPVRILKDELIVDDEADDMLSKFIRGCDGVININTPFGRTKYKRNKTNKRIRKIKTAPGRA